MAHPLYIIITQEEALLPLERAGDRIVAAVERIRKEPPAPIPPLGEDPPACDAGPRGYRYGATNEENKERGEKHPLAPGLAWHNFYREKVVVTADTDKDPPSRILEWTANAENLAAVLEEWAAAHEARVQARIQETLVSEEPALRDLATRLVAEKAAKEAEKAAAEAKRKEEAAKPGKEALRLARLASLVRGFPALRERIAAGPGPLGLVPEGEAMRALEDASLHVSDKLCPYVPLTRADIDIPYDVEVDDDGDPIDPEDGRAFPVRFSSEVAATLDSATWERVKVLRAELAKFSLPSGEIREHKATCGHTDVDTVYRHGLLVSLDLGDGLVLRREYAL